MVAVIPLVLPSLGLRWSAVSTTLERTCVAIGSDCVHGAVSTSLFRTQMSVLVGSGCGSSLDPECHSGFRLPDEVNIPEDAFEIYIEKLGIPLRSAYWLWVTCREGASDRPGCDSVLHGIAIDDMSMYRFDGFPGAQVHPVVPAKMMYSRMAINLFVCVGASMVVCISLLLAYRGVWRCVYATRVWQNRCPRCGYSLAGSQHNRCPECGS